MVGLFTHLNIKGLTLKNRIIMPPMHTGLATSQGAVTESLIEHYARRSKMLGLLIVEHSYVRAEGKLSERQLGIHDDDLILGLEDLAGRVHSIGTPVVIQITHAGQKASKEITRLDPVAPSPDETARKLEVDEIESLTEAFGTAAERAMRAGFDGVEVHGAHGFLLNQFLSPLTNLRHDDYGGSFENRTRFPLEVVKRVKEAVGGRLLLYRLGSDDLDPAGLQIEDSQKFSVQLEEAGVDIIDVSGGICGSRPTQLQEEQGYFIPQAEQIKKAVNVPVIGVGGIKEAEYANSLIEEGRVDLVAVGRELVRDPDWSLKAAEALRKQE